MMCCHFGELKDDVAARWPASLLARPVRTSLRSFIRISRQSPRLHASMGFGSLLAQAVRTSLCSFIRISRQSPRPHASMGFGSLLAKKKSLPFPAGSRTSTQIQLRVRRCTHDDFTCSFVLLPERFGAHAPYTFGIQLNGILQSALHVRFLAIPNTSTGETML